MKFSLKHLMVSILLIAHRNIITFEGWPYGLNWENSDSFDNYNPKELTQQLINSAKIKDSTTTSIKWGTIKNSANHAIHLKYSDTTADHTLKYTIEPGQMLTRLPDPYISFYHEKHYPSEFKKTWCSNFRLAKDNKEYNRLVFSVLYHCYYHCDPKDTLVVNAHMEHASSNAQPYENKPIFNFVVSKQEYIIDIDFKDDAGQNTVLSVQENIEKNVYY